MNGSGTSTNPEMLTQEELELQQGYVDLSAQGELQTTDLNFLMCGEQVSQVELYLYFPFSCRASWPWGQVEYLQE